ncbi:MAG: hypothetical protein QM756_36470 [Polyangiaceae bacterium]
MSWQASGAQHSLGAELTEHASHAASESCYLFELSAVKVFVGADPCARNLEPLFRTNDKPLWVQESVNAELAELRGHARWWVRSSLARSADEAIEVDSPAPRLNDAARDGLLSVDASGLACSSVVIGPVGVEPAGCDNWGLRMRSNEAFGKVGFNTFVYRSPARYETREMLQQVGFAGAGSVRRDFLPGIPPDLELQASARKADVKGFDDASVVTELRPVHDPTLRRVIENLNGVGLHACEVRGTARSCSFIRPVVDTPGDHLPDQLKAHLAMEKIERVLARCSIEVDDTGAPRGVSNSTCALTAVVTDEDVYEVVSAIAGVGGGVGAGGNVGSGFGFARAAPQVMQSAARKELLQKAGQLFYRELARSPFGAGPLTGNQLADDEFEARSTDTLSRILGAPAIEHATYTLRVIFENDAVRLRIHVELMVKKNRSAEYYVDASEEELRAYLTQLERANLALTEKLCRELKGKLTDGSCKQ